MRNAICTMVVMLGFVCGAVGESAPQVARDVLELTSGARTRLVWQHCVRGEGKDWDAHTPNYELKTFDTATGRRKVIAPGPASYGFPWITSDGQSIVFTDLADFGKPVVKIIPFEGGEPRKLVDGFGACLWRDPDDGSQWVVVTGGYEVKSEKQQVFRHRLDDPSVKQLVFTGPTSPRFRVSADGRWAASEFPWPHSGIANLEQNRRRVFGRGCNTMMAPDNSYRWYYMVGNHRQIVMHDAGGVNPRTIDVAPPGMRSPVWVPRWTNDVRLITLTAPLANGAGDVYLLRFDEAFTKIERWVKVSDTPDSQSTYANAWIDPQLGRHEGEAPLTVSVPASRTPGAWRVDFGDGTTGTAERIEHTYTQPGTYTLTARSGDRALTGTVVVRPARAPQLTDAVLIDRRRVALRFDEQVQITEPLRGGTRSGRTVTAGELTLDEAGIVITLDGPVASEDRLSVIGVRDRAQRPNAADYRDVAITRPEWPINPDGLTFAWPNAHDARQVYHPGVGSLVDSELDLRGTAKLDRFGAMVTGDDGSGRVGDHQRLIDLARPNGQLGVEMLIDPADLRQTAADDTPVALFAFSHHWQGGGGTLWLLQDGAAIKLVTPRRWGDNQPVITEMGTLPDDGPHHLALSIDAETRQATLYLDGELSTQVDFSPGGLSFVTTPPLHIGRAGKHGPAWRGTVSHLAFYNRTIAADEARAAAELLLGRLAERKPIQTIALQVKLVDKSLVPDPANIKPYTRALAVYEYEVTGVVEGPYEPKRVRVAHWVIHDSKHMPVAQRKAGWTGTLELQRFADHKQLESESLTDTLDLDFDLGLYVEAQ